MLPLQILARCKGESSFATAASKLNDSPGNTTVTVNYIECMSSIKVTTL